jgi:hypothetical protein
MEHSKYEANAHTSYNKGLFESRFKVLLFLYRMAGIPLNVKSVSKLNAVYNVSIIVCFYITNICVGMDTFVHRHQLALAMKSFRVFVGMLMVQWLHFSVR